MEKKDKVVWLSLLVTLEMVTYLAASFTAMSVDILNWPEWLRFGYISVSIAVVIRWVICLDNEGAFND